MDPRALADALMGKGLEQYTRPWMERPEYKPSADPYKAPWAYPEWTARHGELTDTAVRAEQNRPKQYLQPAIEGASLTMGGYGTGHGAATAYQHGREGDWRGAAGEAALLAAGAIMPGTKAAPKQGIRAYHVSPHEFQKFDMAARDARPDGASHGWGHYFADRPVTDIPGGNKFYEVMLNVEKDNLLDWNARLSEQPAPVQKALQDLLSTTPSPFGDGSLWDVYKRGNPQGGALYHAIKADSDKARSDLLRKAGVQGTTYDYTDGPRGTRATVVFDDNAIDIVKKYGIAAAASMYGMDAVQNVMLADKLQEPVQ